MQPPPLLVFHAWRAHSRHLTPPDPPHHNQLTCCSSPPLIWSVRFRSNGPRRPSSSRRGSGSSSPAQRRKARAPRPLVPCLDPGWIGSSSALCQPPATRIRTSWPLPLLPSPLFSSSLSPSLLSFFCLCPVGVPIHGARRRAPRPPRHQLAGATRS